MGAQGEAAEVAPSTATPAAAAAAVAAASTVSAQTTTTTTVTAAAAVVGAPKPSEGAGGDDKTKIQSGMPAVAVKEESNVRRSSSRHCASRNQ